MVHYLRVLDLPATLSGNLKGLFLNYISAYSSEGSKGSSAVSSFQYMHTLRAARKFFLKIELINK